MKAENEKIPYNPQDNSDAELDKKQKAKPGKIEAKIDAAYYFIKRIIKQVINFIVKLFLTMRENFKRNKNNPTFRWLVILIMFRAFSALVLGIICLSVGIYDYNFGRFTRGSFFIYFILAGLLSIFLLLDIISLIRLLYKKRGKIITRISTIIILCLLLLCFLPRPSLRNIETSTIVLLLYIILYNAVILFLSFKAKYNFEEISATLGQPVFEDKEFNNILVQETDNKSENTDSESNKNFGEE